MHRMTKTKEGRNTDVSYGYIIRLYIHTSRCLLNIVFFVGYVITSLSCGMQIIDVEWQRLGDLQQLIYAFHIFRKQCYEI
jgi:uncharacterized membrane protein YciS (DUF1049 family)